VASGGARRGRRDNGLVAAAYAAAGDVDPRIGEHLLDVLGLRGIAAYLQPAADLHPITRTTTLPSPQTDRLWVDREHLDAARDYLAQLTSGTATGPADEADIQEEFAKIVAGFNADLDATGSPWPESENLPADEPLAGPAGGPLAGPAGGPLTGPAGGPGSGPPAKERDGGLPRWTRSTADLPPSEPTLLDGLDTFGADLPDEDEEEGYTPPPPPPLPRISPAALASVLAIVVGVVLFFNPRLLGIDEDLTMVLGFTGILGGFIALIWRMRSGDDDDPDPDDGAVV
jgi:hypothetical protein